MSLSLKCAHRFFIHVRVRTVKGNDWALTEVYASPNPSVRKHLWERLDWIDVSCPLVLAGDFNFLASGGKKLDKRESSSFRQLMQGRCLTDTGYIGSKYTWSHGVSKKTRRSARLDRALCCDKWRRQFALAIVDI